MPDITGADELGQSRHHFRGLVRGSADLLPRGPGDVDPGRQLNPEVAVCVKVVNSGGKDEPEAV